MLLRKWVAVPLVFCGIFMQSVFAAENEVTAEDAKSGTKPEVIRSWYLNYGVDTLGFPIAPVNRISFGFIIANKFDVGFLIGRGEVSGLVKDAGSFKDRVDKLNNAQDISDPNTDPIPGITRLRDQPEEAVFEAIPVSVSGLEFRFPVGGRRFDMPIRLKQLSFEVNSRSTDTLNGIFSLKDKYKSDDPNKIFDVINGERILLFSIGFGNKFRSKWGGNIVAEWLTLEYSLSQPKEVEPIFSFGLFSFEFGIRR